MTCRERLIQATFDGRAAVQLASHVVSTASPIVFIRRERFNRLELSTEGDATHMATEAKPNPIPARYRRITPALIVNGGNKALEFYGDVFGASERMRFPGPNGTVAHAEVEIGDSVIIV